MDSGPGRAQHLPRALIYRILDRNLVARLDQDPRDQVQRLLRAVDDDHLRGVAHDRARSPQMRGDRFTQRLGPFRRTVVELADPYLSRAAVQDALPLVERKAIDDAAPVGKVIAQRLRMRLRKDDRRARRVGEGAKARQLVPGRFHGASRASGEEAVRHERSRAHAADDESFGEQLVVREHDDCARDSELLGEIPRRRKTVARAELARQDRLPHPDVDLTEQRFAALREWYQKLHEKWTLLNTIRSRMFLHVGS